jgi:hypothetical protein
MEIRRGMEKATKQSLAAIATAARANGAQSPEESLYSRLQIPAAAGCVVTQRPIQSAKPTDLTPGTPMTPAQVARTILEDK